MGRDTVIILTAVALESRAIARALGFASRGEINGSTVTLHTIGIGAVRPPDAEDLEHARCIVMAGLAGGLDPSLRIGDIVLEHDGPPWPVVRPNWRVGKILSSTALITAPAEKAAAFRRSGALAVEMENAIVRPLAQKLGIPFVAVRAISDTADEAIDPAVIRLIDPFGRPRPLRLAAALLRQPRIVPQLRRLGGNANRAADSLGECVRLLLESGALFPSAGESGKN